LQDENGRLLLLTDPGDSRYVHGVLGVVEFYQWREDTLQIVARVPGYTSHVIGTRNLDMAAAGDFDGDGRFELLLPNQQRTTLGGIRRTEDGRKWPGRCP
jgi:hypothetical protein